MNAPLSPTLAAKHNDAREKRAMSSSTTDSTLAIDRRAGEEFRARGRWRRRNPQDYRFGAALTVRPPFFELANEERLQACGSLLAEPGWPDDYARLPRRTWRFVFRS
jgi:hypothetical protein